MGGKLRELEARLLRASSAPECLALLLEIAEAQAALHRNREALRSAREALNIAQVRGDGACAGRALTIASRCHYQRGDYPMAVATGLDALDAVGDRDLHGRSVALQELARTLLTVESYDLAEEIAERAAADALRAGHAAAEAGARTLWGAILAQRDRFQAARRQFREAGAIQRRLGDKVMLKRSAASIADGYRTQATECAQRGELDEARMLWRQAIRVYRVALHAGLSPMDDAMSLAHIAQCECRLERFQEALAAVREGLAYAVQSRSPQVLAHCYLWESQALAGLGRIDTARRACECARDAAEQLDHDAILAECLKAESRLNDLSGRFDSAQDLERRAERAGREREAFFARVRDDVARLWERHAAPA